jgi:hypothetical protein
MCLASGAWRSAEAALSSIHPELDSGGARRYILHGPAF